MQCPKCHKTKFKPLGEDMCCMNCGTLILAPQNLHIIKLPKPQASTRATHKGRPIDEVSREIRAYVSDRMAEIKAHRMNGLGWAVIAAKIGLTAGRKASVQRHYEELSA